MRRISVSTALLLLSGLFVAITTVSIPSASASSPSANVSTVAFNSIPSSGPGNVPSDGFEATSTSEFGDYATFANDLPSSHLGTVNVLMSSWGCESGSWFDDTCLTTPDAAFSEPVTFTIYQDVAGAPGDVIATKTQTFEIPFRPSAEDGPNCTGALAGDGGDLGKWYSTADGKCYNGLAVPITFDFSNDEISLPSSVIYSVAYNTTHYGYSPIGEAAACYTEDGGCGYDSLNLGVSSTTPSIGTDDDVNGVFQNSSWDGAYCDGGTGGTGTFRLDTGCWATNNPDVTFNVVSPGAPVDLAQADHGNHTLDAGDLTDTGTVKLSATVGEPDDNGDAALRVQVAPVNEDFTGANVVTETSDTTHTDGDNVTVTVDNLPNGRYHWRARVLDGAEALGDWSYFGSNSDGAPPATPAATDFINGPSDPTLLAQADNNSQSLLNDGLSTGTVTLSGTVADPDGGNLSLEVEAKRIGDAFDGNGTATSIAVASGSTASETVTSLADGRYHWRARTVDANGVASHWVSFGGNNDGSPADPDFRVNVPTVPTALAQTDNNSQPLGLDGLTDNSVTLSATLNDPDYSALKLQVEAERIGTAFTGTPSGTSDPTSNSGDTASVTLSNLSNGRYHWQARTVDPNGDKSGWVSFGGNNDGSPADVDFRVNVPVAPAANSLAQADNNGAPLASDGLTDNKVTLSGTVTDPDYQHNLKLEFDVQRIGTAFDNADTTHLSDATNSGQTASVTLTALSDGRYHWRVRTVDQNNDTSNWVSYGGNSDGNPPTTNADIDFRVNAPSDPTVLFQQKPNGDAISIGGNTDGQGGNNKRSVTLGATTADPDNRNVQLKIQVAATNKPFSDANTLEKTSSLAPGGPVSLTFNSGDGLNANQNYHWRARTIDNDGNASRWVNFGGNSDTVTADTDFRVPQADLSVTQQPVLGTSGLTSSNSNPNDHVNVALNDGADLTGTHTHNLVINFTVSNTGPDRATNVQVKDDVLSIMDTTTAQHPVFASATYCGVNGINCLNPSPLPPGGVINVQSGLDASGNGSSASIRIVATLNADARRGPVQLPNVASASSDVYDPVSANDSDSKPFTVNTVPRFDVQPGNGNAIVSWSPPPTADEAAVDHYRLKITGGPSAITVDPVPMTACTGRNGGTLCYNRTGLTNGTTYNFQLFAVTSAGTGSTLRDGSEGLARPSVDDKATNVTTTTTSFSTCTTATQTHPICVTTTVPSGGGGVFSVQNAITGYSNFQFANFCGTDPNPANNHCGAGIGSFEGHPPAGYNNPNNPIQLTVTWDRTAWAGTENSIFYQADSLHGGVPFQLVKCTNQSVDTAFTDPCIKKTNVLGSKKGDSCTLKAACFGDLQAQILLTSAADGGFAKKG